MKAYLIAPAFSGLLLPLASGGLLIFILVISNLSNVRCSEKATHTGNQETTDIVSEVFLACAVIQPLSSAFGIPSETVFLITTFVIITIPIYYGLKYAIWTLSESELSITELKKK